MWFKWFLIGLLCIDLASTTFRVGEPREPIDSATAAGGTLINLLLIAGILYYWGRG